LNEELRTYRKFFLRTPAHLRDLVFYSAQAQYISFFQGVLDELCRRGANITYITSDHNDPILIKAHPNITPYYFNTLFPFVLPFLDAKVIVMTMPDLHRYHIRRSIYPANHIYMFHSLMSTHMGFRPGALDHFDTIFCAGPHHKEEIQRTEKLYRLKPKRLLETGYSRLEKIHADHQNYRQAAEKRSNPLVLIAPSGHADNIMSTCAHELIAALLQSGLDVVFRPHPMTIYRKPDQIAALRKSFDGVDRFSLDLETTSELNLHRADMLISDWSGIALEYAFGTERPVLSIDLPRRQQNPEYELLEIPAIEVFLRDKIGRSIRVDEISGVGAVVRTLIEQKEHYREEIARLRSQFVYNFGSAAKHEADYILKIYHNDPVG